MVRTKYSLNKTVYKDEDTDTVVLEDTTAFRNDEMPFYMALALMCQYKLKIRKKDWTKTKYWTLNQYHQVVAHYEDGNQTIVPNLDGFWPATTGWEIYEE